jgi:hypothetical protein
MKFLHGWQPDKIHANIQKQQAGEETINKLWLLAIGHWSLAISCWLLAIGYWLTPNS